ncbi:amino acid ABC transporter permease [Coprothermobacteraceae bacterium]|nr:amino acid ABC transporter permease [Coprothermobacteraceae bacterium]
MSFRLELLVKIFPLLWSGFLMTLQLTFLSLAIGLVAGLFLALMKISKSKILKAIAVVYIEFIRGTPALMQILAVYFGLPALGVNLDRFTAAVVALGINSAAYSAEIFRAGIESIDKGQMEAARSIGMTYSMAMRLVVLPQAFRVVIPPLVNEFVALLKDTSLVSVIGVADLMLRTRNMISYTANVFTPLIGASILYLMATIPGSQLSNYLERRFKF